MGMYLYFLGAVYVILVYILICYGQKRAAAGFVLAPLAPGLVGAIGTENFMAAVFVTPFAYLFALSGVPIFLLFRRFGWLAWWQVTAAGAILGGVISLSIGLNALALAVYGAVTGLTFWLVAFAGGRSNSRLNRDAQKAARPLS